MAIKPSTLTRIQVARSETAGAGALRPLLKRHMSVLNVYSDAMQPSNANTYCTALQLVQREKSNALQGQCSPAADCACSLCVLNSLTPRAYRQCDAQLSRPLRHALCIGHDHPAITQTRPLYFAPDHDIEEVHITERPATNRG